MKTVLILIHEVGEMSAGVDDLIPVVCPYLGTLGEQANIASIEHLQEYVAGSPERRATLLRLSINGTARVSFEALTEKLQRFMKKAARDAEISVKIAFLVLQVPEAQTALPS